MSEQEIIDGNRLIAEFMGAKYGEDSPNKISKNGYLELPDDSNYKFSKWTVRFSWIEELQYHSSWDWLMPIYTKINRYISERCLTDFVFATNTEQLHLNLWMALEDCSDTPLVLWFHVVEFIKWYNENKSK